MRDADQTKTKLAGEPRRLRKQTITKKGREEQSNLENDLFQSLKRNPQIGVYLIRDGRFLSVNSYMINILGYTEEELLKMKVAQIIHPDDQGRVHESVSAMLQGKSTEPYEFRFLTRGGEIRWASETVNIINFQGRKTVLGSSVDVTDKIIARQKFAELEALEATILDSIPHAVIGLKNRRIIFANEGLYTVFGWKPEELIGQTTRILFRSDEEYDHGAVKNLYAILEAQRVFRTELTYRHKNGRDVICLVSCSRIGSGLKDRGIVVTYEDITERKKAEQKLALFHEQIRSHSAHLESAREEERTSIARELHDELGQLLTVLNMDLVLIGKKMPAGQPFLQEKIAEMIKLVETILDSLKRISMALRPDLLDHLGLAEAIEWQANNFHKHTGIPCKLSVEAGKLNIVPNLATAVYRIFQETLTNIARHAGASAVAVSLKASRERIILKVKDNGKGVTADEQAKSAAFGLIGIRERAYHWGGEVKIKGREGKGTTVSVSIPLPGKDETP
ncbi:MAG: Oxygen sensor histidine kinase NreB [Smithella sp. PtaU1.Bin162]|nr:MAG: Oxygen sensor histidine kinase NreB [Smithella sp. PtaU1.Bin162]